MMQEGCAISRCTMEPLMREIGLARGIRGKPVRTTISDRAAPCPRDHVNRQFYAPAPNMQWVSDSPYVATGAGSSTSALRQVQDRLHHRQPRPPGRRMACQRNNISHSSQTRSGKPFTAAGRSHVAASFITATAAHNTCRSRTSSGSPRPGSSRRSALSATPCLPKRNANIIVSQTTWTWRGDLKSQGLCQTRRLFEPRFRVD